MEIIVGWLIFAGLVGYWASQWGRSGAAWFLFALLLSPLIAGIALAIAGRKNPARGCPVCGNPVPVGLTKCASCGYDFALAAAGRAQQIAPKDPDARYDCGSCGKPLSPYWREKCNHCGTPFAAAAPVAR